MSKERSHIADFLVYLLVRFFVCVVQMLPSGAVRGLARGLAWLAYRVDRRHRQVADENLKHAYGDSLTADQRDAMIQAVYVHFCTVLLEIIRLPRLLHVHNWKRRVELVGADLLVRALLSGRPVLIVTGHLGNWEVAGYTLGLLGVRSHAIARTLDNPLLDRFLRSFRERTGQKVLAKKGEVDGIQEVLHRGGVLATLADQDAGQRGLYVDFFGRPASTHKAVALLALQYGVLMLVVGAPRVGPKYRIVVSELIDPLDYQDRPDAVKVLTARYTSALERLVRQAPEQYFWLHRRWKHQPQQRKNKEAA